jgi:hypothetical protein
MVTSPYIGLTIVDDTIISINQVDGEPSKDELSG